MNQPQTKAWTGLISALVAVAVIVLVMLLIVWWQGRRDEPARPWPTASCEASLADGRQAQLSPEQAANASLIAGVAQQRGLIPRATSIALTTAFQESGLRNLDYGDLDSLGLFQQRPAADWGTAEQIMDPYYSSNAFFDALVKVPGWETADIGDVAQAVQRSAFPDAYDQHVERARILASALSGESPAAWSCHLRDPQPGDPVSLTAALDRTYGPQLTIDLPTAQEPSSDPNPTSPQPELTVRTSSSATAWSAAAFIQSHAAAYGIKQIQVGAAVWTGQPDLQAQWVTPDPSTDPASSLEATSLTIQFF